MAVNVWCDALCIKQGDDLASLQERAEQIVLMSRIFGKASRVIIDLGPDDGTLGTATEGINAILGMPEELKAQYRRGGPLVEFPNLPPYTDLMWSALGSLLSRPWFQRIWCVQEAILARDIKVIFGDSAMSFQALILVARVYLSVSSAAMKYRTRFGWELLDTARTNNAMVSLFAIYQQRQARLNGAVEVHVDLCELIRSTLNEHSTDRRDRVYALYGLIGTHVAEELPVDYAQSVHQLSQRLSIYLIGHGNAVWTLIHSGGINDFRPSWSVDLNSLDGRHRMDYLSWTTSANGHNPAYAAGGTEPPAFQLDGSGRRVKVHGMVVEGLSSMADAFHFPIGTMVGLDEGAKLTPKFIMSYVLWLDYVVDWAAQLPDSDPEATWRTLVGERWLETLTHLQMP